MAQWAIAYHDGLVVRVLHIVAEGRVLPAAVVPAIK